MKRRTGSTATAPEAEGRRPTPLQHVFVATDFSAGAARALARAGCLPLMDGGRITVLHVMSEKVPASARARTETGARAQLRGAVAALKSEAAAHGRRGVQVDVDVCSGKAYVEIIRRARATGADLIVLGRHGEHAVRDLFIGSTAERVVRMADIPVLVAHNKSARAYRRPLLAVDLEDAPRSLVELALRAVEEDMRTLTMVHAFEVAFEGFISPMAQPGDVTTLRKDARDAAAAALEKVQASLVDLGVQLQSVIVRGDPRVAILTVAERRRADLLVVGTHGRSGIAHALVGSVAEYIIESAICDVLVARPSRVSFEPP